MSTLSCGTLMFRLKEHFSVFVIFLTNETSIKGSTSFLCSALEFNWVWISLFMDINVVGQLAPVTAKVFTGDLPL